jgi:hypothetical protein
MLINKDNINKYILDIKENNNIDLKELREDDIVIFHFNYFDYTPQELQHMFDIVRRDLNCKVVFIPNNIDIEIKNEKN